YLCHVVDLQQCNYFSNILNIASHAFPWEKAIKMYKDMYTYIIKDKYSIVVLSHSLNQGKI
ncbi:hypothetical protein OLP55_06615, partial [Campylobacter jejuni]|nr:hypothetical protein [Campylobacter jejuni]